MTSNSNQLTQVKTLFQDLNITKRFEQLLGANSQGFITSVLQVVSNNDLLKKADPQTILTAAATAAALKLPINPNLGFAYIIPYNKKYKDENGKTQWKVVAQFQMGYKGFIQLAQRTGLYKRINAVRVYQNQFKSWNPLTEELEADFTIPGEGMVVGYAAFFLLLNGFSKTTFWTWEQTHDHAKKYSKSYNKPNGLWSDKEGGADAMGMKTVLKLILSKYGPMEISTNQIATAIQADQSVQTEEGEFDYVDNPKGLDVENVEYKKQRDRLIAHIAKATEEQLLEITEDCKQFDCWEEYENRLLELKK